MTDIIVHTAPARSGHHFIRYNISSWLGISPRVPFINFEGGHPSRFQQRWDQIRDRFLTQYKKVLQLPEDEQFNFIHIVSTRDLLNWLASVYGMQEKRGHNLKPLGSINSWAEIAREVFGLTNYISNGIPVVYDLFVESEDYRRVICSQLGGEYNEEYLDFIPAPGRGSSFDGFDLQGAGSQMKVKERYRTYSGNSTYKENLRRHPEILQLYRDTFDPLRAHGFFSWDSKKIDFIDKL